jgi:radical SAM protein with 4Fe4S-binding SPASM domain
MGKMKDSKNQILGRKDIPGIMKFIREKNKERKILLEAADNIGYYYDDLELYIRGQSDPLCFWTGCTAGTTGLFIDSVGNVKGCGALYDDRFIEGNLRESSLRAIWENENGFSYNRKFTTGQLSGTCSACDVGAVCQGGCRASNYFMTGSLYENAFCAHNLSM